MAATWLDTYSSGISLRDQRANTNSDLITAYTTLADRLSTQPVPSTSAPESTDLASLRADLTSTHRARTTLQTNLDDLKTQHATLLTTSTAQASRIKALEKQVADSQRRLRDRDEELKIKNRLVESVQDEMVGLSLQMNMAEQRAEKLREENAELVRRFMDRVGLEAEEMNRGSGF